VSIRQRPSCSRLAGHQVHYQVDISLDTDLFPLFGHRSPGYLSLPGVTAI
jgi:hypothetical protein